MGPVLLIAYVIIGVFIIGVSGYLAKRRHGYLFDEDFGSAIALAILWPFVVPMAIVFGIPIFLMRVIFEFGGYVDERLKERKKENDS